MRKEITEVPKQVRKVKKLPLETWSAFPVSYEVIYREGTVWTRTSMLGRTSLACQLSWEALQGGVLLDVGCGGGRLPILASSVAKEVIGIDPAQEAINVAKLIASACEISNAQCICTEVEAVDWMQKFDVVTVMGVLEHVEEPAKFLSYIAKLMKPNGLLIVEVPSFQNFRGDVYMTLLTLFDYPMSLADIRQVTSQDMTTWSRASHLSVERVVGYQYGLGWLEKGVEDLIARVPAAMANANSELIEHWNVFEQWIRSRIVGNRSLIAHLSNLDLFQRIEHPRPVSLPRGAQIPDASYEALELYVRDDPSGDPFYCDQEPFNQMGAGTMYFLRRS